MAHFTQTELNKKRELLVKLRQKYFEIAREHGNTSTTRDCHNMLSEPFATIELRMRYIMKQIKEIQHEIQYATIVDTSQIQQINGSIIISYGCCALVRYLNDNEEEKLIIRHLDDELDNDNLHYSICTPESPLGKLLIGKTRGFKGEYITPNNQSLGVEILNVFIPTEPI